MFSQSVVEKIQYYVYFLMDPRNKEVFYVGKGKDNRVFQHVEDALTNQVETDKLDRIREIKNSGQKVQHFILRHGLTEREAFEVEAAVIDFAGKGNLTNQQSGHHSDYGLKATSEVISMYEAKELNTSLPILLININKLFNREMDASQIYEATRSSWVLGERRKNARYAVATYRGLTRIAYEIDEWNPENKTGKTRWEFIGRLADEAIQNELIYKSVESFYKKGSANPIKYINC
jgi:hypothetical protein